MTSRNLVRARVLWDEGVSCSQIARRLGLGCTKSALVGYAHRQGWPSRPSPLPPKRPGAHAKKAVPRAPVPPRAPAEPLVAIRTCQWSDSVQRPWVWCGAPTVRNGPWCAEHRARCFHGYARSERAA